MKALVSADYQPLDGLTVADLPTPSAGPGEVVVRVEAAALNPLDLALITGAMKDFFPVEHPLVVGMDAAGTVAEVGTGVTGYAPGDAVLAFTGQAGAVAEYTVVTPGPKLARRPSALDAVRAAAIPESGMTAVCLLRAVGLSASQSVLVIGATGGVGLYAVQLAAALGAKVIATATAQDADYVRGSAPPGPSTTGRPTWWPRPSPWYPAASTWSSTSSTTARAWPAALGRPARAGGWCHRSSAPPSWTGT